MKHLTAKWTVAAGLLCLAACSPVNFDEEQEITPNGQLPITLGDVCVSERATSRLQLSDDGSATASAFNAGDKLRLTINHQGESVQSTVFTASTPEEGTVTWEAANRIFWPLSFDGYELCFMPEGKDSITLNNGDALPDILSTYVSTQQAPTNGRINTSLQHRMAQIQVEIELKSNYYTESDLLGEETTLGSPCSLVTLTKLHSIAKIACNGEYREDGSMRDIHLIYRKKDPDSNTYTFTAIVPANYPFCQFIINVADQRLGLQLPSPENNSLSAGKSYTYHLELDKHLAMSGEITVSGWTIHDETLSYTRLTPWNGGVAHAFDKGDGTDTAPFEITNGEQLALMAQLINTNQNISKGNAYKAAHYKLTQDIDLNELPWTPISLTPEQAFEGYFDGGNHTISRLRVIQEEQSYDRAGLFGRVTNATICNLKVTGTLTVETDSTMICIGGIAGAINPSVKAEIINCHFTGSLYGQTTLTPGNGLASIGGIIGYIKEQNTNAMTYIKECSAQGTFTAKSASANGMAGGIAGFASSCSITGCSSSGTTVHTYSTQNLAYAGGITGKTKASTLEGCTVLYNTILSESTLTAKQQAYSGGITANVDGSVIACLSYGVTVRAEGSGSADGFIGGIAGHIEESGKTYNCLSLNTRLNKEGSGAYGAIAGLCEGTAEACYSDQIETKSGKLPITGQDAEELKKGIDQTLNNNLQGRSSLFRWVLTPGTTGYRRYWPEAIQ